MIPADLGQHREWLNAYYGSARHVYDLTRRYYLFGRDLALDELAMGRWTTLVEVGFGTGRNLRRLRQLRPDAILGGVDAADTMLAHARRRMPGVRLVHGFAEQVDLPGVLGVRPDRVLLSYALSMFPDPAGAIRNLRRGLAPHGELWIVDFGDLAGLPAPVRDGLRSWLGAFHVQPGPPEGLVPERWGPGRYWYRLRLPATD